MDARNKKVKCLNCSILFLPDHRNRGRQQYCSEPSCRKASKAASQKRWLDKPGNQDYFRGSKCVQRVQDWRQSHPGYWRRKERSADNALQDPLPAQPSEIKADIAKSPKSALQDAYSEPSRPPIPDEAGHRFRSKAATDSERSRPPIPIQSGHPVTGDAGS